MTVQQRVRQLLVGFIPVFVFLLLKAPRECVAASKGINDLSRNYTLRVTTLLTRPYLSLRHSALSNETIGQTNEFSGYIKELLELVSSRAPHLNFELQLVADNLYGRFNEENGTWNGMIGEVIRGEADMAAGPLTASPKRMKVVDFSQPFQVVGPVVVLKKPQYVYPSIARRFLYLSTPLTYTVWMTIGIAYLIVGAILYIVSYTNPYEWRKLGRDSLATIREAESFSCVNTYWFIMSTFMVQGFVRTPRSLGGRIITTFWFVFVLLSVLTYVASLTNLVRIGEFPEVSASDLDIRNLMDLSRQKKIHYGALADGNTLQFLERSQLEHFEKIWETMASNPKMLHTKSVQQGVDRVRSANGMYAFVMESVMAKYYVDQDPCDLQMVGSLVATHTYAFALPRNSRFRNDIDIALGQLRRDAVLQQLEEKWFKGECGVHSDPMGKYQAIRETFNPVQIGSFSGALILLIGGVVLGIIVSLIECCIFKWVESLPDAEEPTTNQETPSRVSTKHESDV